MKQEQKKQTRKPYRKPVLRTIELTADEVLAAGCKTSGTGFNSGAAPCSANNCSAMGS